MREIQGHIDGDHDNKQLHHFINVSINPMFRGRFNAVWKEPKHRKKQAEKRKYFVKSGLNINVRQIV